MGEAGNQTAEQTLRQHSLPLLIRAFLLFDWGSKRLFLYSKIKENAPELLLLLLLTGVTHICSTGCPKFSQRQWLINLKNVIQVLGFSHRPNSVFRKACLTKIASTRLWQEITDATENKKVCLSVLLLPVAFQLLKSLEPPENVTMSECLSCIPITVDWSDAYLFRRWLALKAGLIGSEGWGENKHRSTSKSVLASCDWHSISYSIYQDRWGHTGCS